MNIKLKTFLLSFEGPLHLSRGREGAFDSGQDTFHSDSLKAALFVTALQLYPADQVEAVLGNSVLVSSAFPYWDGGNNGKEYFFPKPMVRLPFDFHGMKPEDAAIAGKKLKKIRYLGQSWFEACLDGSEKEIMSNHLMQGGAYLSERLAGVRKQDQQISKVVMNQRVHIPENPAVDTVPFYMEKRFFGPKAGLWFAAQGGEAGLNMLRAALKLLGDSGIGTDRNVGNGQFEFSEGEINLRVPDDHDHCLNLSLFCPESQAEWTQSTGESAAWMMMKRGGYLASPQQDRFLTHRKRSIYMVSEGSVWTSKVLKGKVVDLRPDSEGKESGVGHPVWRDGRPICIPIKINPS